MSDTAKQFTTHTLYRISEEIQTLRIGYLYDVDSRGADPSAEQLYLLVLTKLEEAQRLAKLAEYHQSKALATLPVIR